MPFPHQFGQVLSDPVEMSQALQANFRQAYTKDEATGLFVPKSAFTAADTVLYGTGTSSYGERTRAQRFKAGTFSCPAGTGAFAVTGVGFRPGAIVFTSGYGISLTDEMVHGTGGCDAAGSQWAHAAYAKGSGHLAAYNSITNHCLYAIGVGSATIYAAQFTSMDADGFTLNFTTGHANGRVSYIAYA